MWRACVALARSIASKFSLETGPFDRLAFGCPDFALIAFLPRLFFAIVRSLDPSSRILVRELRSRIRDARAALDLGDKCGKCPASRGTYVIGYCLVVRQQQPDLSTPFGVVEIDDPRSTRFAAPTRPNAQFPSATRRHDGYASSRVGNDRDLCRSKLIIRKKNG
jgi:hypothetical protein